LNFNFKKWFSILLVTLNTNTHTESINDAIISMAINLIYDRYFTLFFSRGGHLLYIWKFLNFLNNI
jgi:hypothetical protein